MGKLRRATSAVPIVFAIVPDPVCSGFVDSPSRPALLHYRPAFADTPRTEVVFADTYDKIGPLGAESQGECAITPDRIFDKLGVATCR